MFFSLEILFLKSDGNDPSNSIAVASSKNREALLKSLFLR